MAQPIGNLTARFRNSSDGRINVNTTLAGPYNDASIVGFYNPENVKQAIDLTIDLKTPGRPYHSGIQCRRTAAGERQATGAFTVNGTAANPQLKR
jgi:hypothetical protein